MRGVPSSVHHEVVCASHPRDNAEARVGDGDRATGTTGSGRGPARVFLDHPLVYAAALTGSGAAATYALYRAAVADRRSQRAAMAALGAQCAAQLVGILVVTEVARARRRSAVEGRGAAGANERAQTTP